MSMDDKYELINDLLDESSLVLNYVLTDVMQLEENPHVEYINRLTRAFQSIKDISHMAGFERLSELARWAEGVLYFMRSGRYQADNLTIDFLLNTVETMHRFLDDIRDGKSDIRHTADLFSHLKKIEAAAKAEARDHTLQASLSAPHYTPTGEKQRAAWEALTAHDRLHPEHPLELKHPASMSRPPLQRPLRILVVEDEKTSRSVLVQFLSEFGPCDEAQDGMQAVQAVVNAYAMDPPQPYDLICMDIIMPVMEGTLSTKKIREIERNKGVEGTEKEAAIIMTSAVSDPATIIKACYECGANYYFIKPLVFKQMRRQLQKLNLIP